MQKIKNRQHDLENKLTGYKKQNTKWTVKINSNEKTLDEINKKIEKLEENQEKANNDNQSLKTEIEEVTEKQTKVTEIVSSQEFMSKKYDDFTEEVKEIKNDVREIKKKQETNESKIHTQETKLVHQEHKTEHMFTYSRQDHVLFSGVPICSGPDGYENCKEMVVNICRELHYNIPINEISTAHRLKQHQGRPDPPGIIVRFKDRDIRNDVLRLKAQVKGKRHWMSYGIHRLFINEQLTPDKRRLMYQTKLFIREMDRIHGHIFVWTYKGDIFIRKNVRFAPKRKNTSMKDLIITLLFQYFYVEITITKKLKS